MKQQPDDREGVAAWETLVDAEEATDHWRRGGNDRVLLDYSDFACRVLTDNRQFSYGVGRFRSRLIPYYDDRGDHRLYLKLARIDPSEKSIFSFAAEHGLLGVNVERRFIITPADLTINPFRGGSYYGDTFTEWEEEINDMRIAIELDKMINQSEDVKLLRRCISWTTDPLAISLVSDDEHCVYKLKFDIGDAWHDMPVYDFNHHIINGINQKNYRGLARYIIYSIINEKMVKYVSQEIIPLVKKNSPESMIIEPLPLCLLGLLWLQFANVLAGVKQKCRCICAECGLSFLADRRDVKWCNPSCRQKHYRKNANSKDNNNE